MLWKPVRRLLAFGIRLIAWHPVISLVVAVLALGAAGVAVGGLNDARIFSGPATAQGLTSSPLPIPTVPVRHAPSIPPPASVESYLNGMVAFNAHLMWESLDPTAVQAMVSQGGSEQELQRRLDDAKQNGARYDDVSFVGGYPLSNGDSYMFYVVTRRGFAGPNVADQIFFVFTVGSNGKIVKIE